MISESWGAPGGFWEEAGVWASARGRIRQIGGRAGGEGTKVTKVHEGLLLIFKRKKQNGTKVHEGCLDPWEPLGSPTELPRGTRGSVGRPGGASDANQPK